MKNLHQFTSFKAFWWCLALEGLFFYNDWFKDNANIDIILALEGLFFYNDWFKDNANNDIILGVVKSDEALQRIVDEASQGRNVLKIQLFKVCRLINLFLPF